VEKIHRTDGLALEELEAQTLDLLPDREELMYPGYDYGKKHAKHAEKILQVNYLEQWADADADKYSVAIAANAAEQSNVVEKGDGDVLVQDDL
jgi:hypothetical protein